MRRSATALAAAGGAGSGPLRMRVRAQGVDFGRLAGGVLAQARAQLGTDVDAAGDLAVSNAVKALALANLFAKQESSHGVVFVPLLVVGDGGVEGAAAGERKLVRLSVSPRRLHSAAGAGAVAYPEDGEDWSQGGIYVPADAAAAGRGGGAADRAGPATSSGRGTEEAAAGSPAAPSRLARTVVGEWLRHAAPELRTAARVEAAARAGGAAVQTPAAAAGRKRAPFLVTMAPAALSRAVKAIAFACADLGRAHLSGAPPLAVVPWFWERQLKDRYSGQEKSTKLVVLRLVRAG